MHLINHKFLSLAGFKTKKNNENQFNSGRITTMPERAGVGVRVGRQGVFVLTYFSHNPATQSNLKLEKEAD